jgi:GDPmannose 4,6-dehydratase
MDCRDYVRIDPSLIRPAEVDHLIADASKARRTLRWSPTVRFEELVKMMVDEDIRLVRRKLAMDAGV